MQPIIPYVACVVGAIALFFVLRSGKHSVKVGWGIVGLATFAWVLVKAATYVATPAEVNAGIGGISVLPEPFFAIFSLIAIASAARMITHHRPVYCALYFIMVVLSSAGMFLLLDAEFMAFALIIVYAGAILITYLFVLMLAQQAPQADNPNAQPEYDVNPREPGFAAGVGFIMLVLFVNMVFDGVETLPQPPTVQQANTETWLKSNLMPKHVAQMVNDAFPGAVIADDAEIVINDGVASIDVFTPGSELHSTIDLPIKAQPSNIHLVGLDLVAKFPVSLELAGVILLMAMFGAVVLARKQIEHGEDEVRAAAGMDRVLRGVAVDERERGE